MLYIKKKTIVYRIIICIYLRCSRNNRITCCNRTFILLYYIILRKQRLVKCTLNSCNISNVVNVPRSVSTIDCINLIIQLRYNIARGMTFMKGLKF